MCEWKSCRVFKCRGVQSKELNASENFLDVLFEIHEIRIEVPNTMQESTNF